MLMRILSPLAVLRAPLALATLVALSACSDDPTYTFTDELPVVALGDNSCVRAETLHMDIAAWSTAVDDLVVGTVASVTPVWDRTFTEDGDPVYDDCAGGVPAFDITLSDVTSLKTEREFPTVTLRMGAPAAQLWLDAGYRLSDTWGASNIHWVAPDERPTPLEPGTRLVAGYYALDEFNVIMNHVEPLIVVDEHDRLFAQEFTHTDCDFVGLTNAEVVMGLTGQKLDYLQHLVDITSAVDFPTNKPANYRSSLGLNSIVLYDPFTGGVCTTVAGVGGDTGDDDGSGDDLTP